MGQATSHASPSNRNKRPPRQVIMRFLDCNDKTDLLRAFRKHNTLLELKGDKLLMFQDFSADVVKCRCNFGPICSRLFEQKIRFCILYPATLMVFQEGGPRDILKTRADVINIHPERDSTRWGSGPETAATPSAPTRGHHVSSKRPHPRSVLKKNMPPEPKHMQSQS